MAANDTQREKAAKVLGELLTAYGDLNPRNITRFEGHVVNELKQRPELRSFGITTGPDRTITLSLRKSGLDESAFSDAILISFERDDRVSWLIDGKRYER
jgi:hypothetical protein